MLLSLCAWSSCWRSTSISLAGIITSSPIMHPPVARGASWVDGLQGVGRGKHDFRPPGPTSAGETWLRRSRPGAGSIHEKPKMVSAGPSKALHRKSLQFKVLSQVNQATIIDCARVENLSGGEDYGEVN